jgi:hypothetical protein
MYLYIHMFTKDTYIYTYIYMHICIPGCDNFLHELQLVLAESYIYVYIYIHIYMYYHIYIHT